MTHSTQAKPNRVLQANLALALAFIPNLFMFFLISLIVYHNDRMYAYMFGNLRDKVVFSALTFAAILFLANMAWHSLIAPNPKLRAWLLDDIFNPLLK